LLKRFLRHPKNTSMNQRDTSFGFLCSLMLGSEFDQTLAVVRDAG
jgi:hypothetical protein